VYDFVRRKKLEVLAEPIDEYYGDRVFCFIDPFGYEWKISKPIPAQTPPSPQKGRTRHAERSTSREDETPDRK
jgi:hypothetical protein